MRVELDQIGRGDLVHEELRMTLEGLVKVRQVGDDLIIALNSPCLVVARSIFTVHVVGKNEG